MLKPTPHPVWIEEFLSAINPCFNQVIKHRIFRDLGEGKLSLKRFRGALINFYPLIESFPKYLALNLAKVPAGNSTWSRRTRYWLITNINQERLHAGWWRQFAIGFGVPKGVLDEEIYPPPEIDAINNYLWRVCTHGSLAEGISAANYAIEGPTGVWTRNVKEGVKRYNGKEGVEVNDKTLEWITAHAEYDDKHPGQALEIIKAYATSREEREKVQKAAKRSLEYYELALDSCYKIFR